MSFSKWLALAAGALIAACGVPEDGATPEAPGSARTQVVAPTACPDPVDPEVHYIHQDPAGCAPIKFTCDPGQVAFSDACGCGCLGPANPAPSSPTCPDPADPKVHYVDTDPMKCAAIVFACEPNQTLFTDACGCGCID